MRPLLRLPARGLFRIKVLGVENLPIEASGDVSAGWICAGVPHRNWVEPVLLLGLLPPGRRVVTVADRRTVTGNRWRSLAARLVGGALPVGHAAGLPGVPAHVAAAAEVVAGGGILAVFPETGPPSAPPALRRLSAGVAYFAAASGAPVVPVVFGGTDELYLGRRIAVRVLPAVEPPAPNSDRASLAAWMAAFRVSVQEAANEAHSQAGVLEPRRKRWRWLTGNYPRA